MMTRKFHLWVSFELCLAVPFSIYKKINFQSSVAAIVCTSSDVAIKFWIFLFDKTTQL